MSEIIESRNEDALLAFIEESNAAGRYSYDVLVNLRSALGFVTRNSVWNDTDLILGLRDRLDEGFERAIRQPGDTIADSTARVYKSYLKRLVRDFDSVKNRESVPVSVQKSSAEESVPVPARDEPQPKKMLRFEITYGTTATVIVSIDPQISWGVRNFMKKQVCNLLDNIV